MSCARPRARPIRPTSARQHSLVWTGWGYIAANVEVPPAKLQGFFNDTQKIAAALAAQGVTPDELARAKAPRIEALQKAQLTNNYWLGELSGAQAEPRRLDVIREIVPGTERVTAADVKRAAQTWFRPERGVQGRREARREAHDGLSSARPSRTPRAG